MLRKVPRGKGTRPWAESRPQTPLSESCSQLCSRKCPQRETKGASPFLAALWPRPGAPPLKPRPNEARVGQGGERSETQATTPSPCLSACLPSKPGSAALYFPWNESPFFQNCSFPVLISARVFLFVRTLIAARAIPGGLGQLPGIVGDTPCSAMGRVDGASAVFPLGPRGHALPRAPGTQTLGRTLGPHGGRHPGSNAVLQGGAASGFVSHCSGPGLSPCWKEPAQGQGLTPWLDPTPTCDHQCDDRGAGFRDMGCVAGATPL